jgi:hypothetical protein
MEYVTVTDVEVISTGMAWKGASQYYITAEHLADMVASQDDPLIRAPRLKLGHLDPRFNGGLTSHDPWNMDADPAFGTLTNLRIEQDGAMLVADVAEVPADLASSLPSAFPNRSAEWVFDYTTAGGRKYTAVLTDLALLGTRAQAVEDLADIVRANLPAAAAQPIVDDLLAAAAAKGVTTLPDHPSMGDPPPAATAQPAASVSVERVASQFNEWVMTDPIDGIDTWWWWCRDVRVDPDEIIAADGEGGTYRVPFTTDGEYQVQFSLEPVQVRETYVDVAAPAAAASAAQARHGQRVLASQMERPDKPARDSNPAAASAGPDTEEHTMALDDNVRMVLERQGLDPETASEEQINAASVFAAAGIEPPVTTVAETEAETEERSEDLVGAAATAKIEELSRELAELKAGSAAREERERKERRDGLASKWVQEGRIAPAEHDHYRQLLDVDEDRTVAIASALTAGRVPVTETEVVDEAFASLGDGPLPDNVSLLTPAQRAQRSAA